MLYVIQNNIFRESNYDNMFHHLDRMGLEHVMVRFEPFEKKLFLMKDDELQDDVEFKTDRKDVFIFGSVPLSNASHLFGWKPGGMYNENHDFEVYGKHYGENMLNHDAVVQNFFDPIPDSMPVMFFARPCLDNKAFAGQVFMRHSWDEMIDDSVKKGLKHTQDNSLRVVIAPIKNVAFEVRCWVVGGKVVTMSQYRFANRVTYKNVDHYDWLRDKVQGFVDVFRPAEAFVIDVCEVIRDGMPNDIKIVEINCINCSGYYDMNFQKLLGVLEEHFN